MARKKSDNNTDWEFSNNGEEENLFENSPENEEIIPAEELERVKPLDNLFDELDDGNFVEVLKIWDLPTGIVVLKLGTKEKFLIPAGNDYHNPDAKKFVVPKNAFSEYQLYK